MRIAARLSVIATVVLSSTAFAQGQPTGGEESVGNVEVKVFERYEATVRSANKLSQQPNYEDTTTKKIEVDYDFSPRIVQTKVELDPIPAAQITTTKIERLPENMVKLGMGNYTTPEFSLILANSRSVSTSWSLALDHFSTATGALRDRSVFNDNYTMNNQLRAGIVNVNTRWRLKADIDLNLRDISYYGIEKMAGLNETLTDSDPSRQRYYKYGASARYERTTNRGNDPFRGVGARYYFLHDRYGASENFVSAMSDWTIPAGDLDLYLGAGADYLNYAADSTSTSAYAIRFKPHVRKETNGIYFTVGLNLAFVGSNMTSVEFTQDQAVNKLYFFPDLKAELPLVRDVLNIFGGWVGDVDLNGLDGISTLNPYIAPGTLVQPTGVNKVYLGFSGRISRRFGYNIQADYNIYSNRALFYRDSATYFTGFDPYLNVEYADMSVFSPRVELTYHHPSGIEVSADASVFAYGREEEKIAYHLPDFKGGIHAAYTWKEKIVLKTDFTITGPRIGFGDNVDLEAAQMPTFYDWRLYTEYRYNKFLSAYLSVNNILNQDYDLWYGYPAQGTRFILGLALRF
ncbi:MAG: hypothetical protein EP346_08170 [Bacteroidetes bacterium]|nr:MAG: hypothetical protein EP346_08170 [Bacteroidota bacterium]